MKQFRLVDNTLGWLTFLIAAFVYCSTIEPTASFWDCPEFITTGYKLEVGHPPGAPFFMLTANLFSQFASDASQVAMMVNMMSALLSATCILFLFWSITHLVRKLILDKDEDMTMAKMISIEGSGLVGALIYTFSDTFWFSAVEGEVYAYSSCFTALVFWMILKWEDAADKPGSDRWLILISYMTGLSIGVHLLNLLCIPAIVLVFYYKKFPNADLKGSLIALFFSMVIVAAVLYGVVPGIITVGGWFELFFVNTLSMPFNTGTIIYLILLISTVVWAIYETYKENHEMRGNIAFVLAIALLGIPFYGYGWSAFIIGVIVLTLLWLFMNYKRKVTDPETKKVSKVSYVTRRIKNTTLCCCLMMMIGYSTYAVIVVRSAANPPMDQNSPEDIFTLGSYLSRDQYGDRPLFYGQTFNSEVDLTIEGNYCKPKIKSGAPIYQKVEKENPTDPDRYFVVRNKDSYVYAQNVFFPRMYDAGHKHNYEQVMGSDMAYTTVMYDRCGEMIPVQVPTFFSNLKFFIGYQCSFMYWRYFLWNFCGRQNDIQGNGENEHGNWITGFSFIDNAMYGDQDLLPDDLKNNKGHNVYYCLPLLLGLIGLFWQAFRGKKGIKQFWVVFFLFFMTGLAIVIYLNQTPSQPRERDYAYAGSFYAFAIWCGMGVAAILDLILRYLKKENVAIAAAVSVVCLIVPVQMASQNWDDHDRSGRYTCRDFGQNYLMSMQDEGNPIIFTNGDNDTFPLWYNQDTEGCRTDARVCNLSYLQTDWYIDQMVRPAWNSPALPITWNRLDYCDGTNDYVYIRPEYKQEILNFYAQNPEGAKQQFGDDPFEIKNVLKRWVRDNKKDADLHIIPTDTLYLNIDKNAVMRSGMMLPKDSAGNVNIPERIAISLKGRSALTKSDLMMLEMVANHNWTRPLYVACTVGGENYMNLGDNFIQEGLVNRITPFRTDNNTNFDTEKVYTNLMTRFKYGGLEKQGLYLDETVMRMCYTHRRLFSQLATHLIAEGKNDKALKALEYCEKVIPEYNVPMNVASGGIDIAEAYLKLGKKEKGEKIMANIVKQCTQYLDWYYAQSHGDFLSCQRECIQNIIALQMIAGIMKDYNEQLANNYASTFSRYIVTYQNLGGTMPEY